MMPPVMKTACSGFFDIVIFDVTQATKELFQKQEHMRITWR
jgi:hypothetical protein